MSLLRWFTHNWADTDEPSHPDITPLELSMSPTEAFAHVEATIRHLSRWQVEQVEPDTATIRATRRSRLFRFVDDVTIRIEPVGDKSRIHARSQSRLGKGDLGQNRRNLIELFQSLSFSHE